MREISARLEEVRQGRELFVRRCLLGKNNVKKRLQIVWVHGLLATEKQFASVLEELDKSVTSFKLDCLLYDWMGCGQSTEKKNAADYQKKESVADLLSLLENLDGTIPTIFVGHSFGPNIIVSALKETTLKPAGVVWISTALNSDTIEDLPDGGHPVMRLPTTLLNCFQRSMTEEFVRRGVHPSNKEVQDVVRQDCNLNSMWAAKCYHRGLAWSSVVDAPNDTRHLIIHGAEDGIIPLSRGQDLAKHLFTSERGDEALVAIEDAGHMVVLEKPQQVAEEIAKFLGSLSF